MDKFFQDSQLQQIQQLANSPAGQALMKALQGKDSDALRRAASSAAGGDLDRAGKDLSALLEDPQIRELLSQLGR